jgi:hypothetical protein
MARRLISGKTYPDGYFARGSKERQASSIHPAAYKVSLLENSGAMGA